MTLTELYKYADEHGIEVYDFSMQQAAAISLPTNQIAIDVGKFDTSCQEKVCLAHEIGHCETGSFYNFNALLDIKAKHEHRANAWAFNQLLPFCDLTAAIQNYKLFEVWEIADFFDLPCEFVSAALEFYSAKSLLLQS